MKRQAAPVIAAVLLLLPALYAGSYLVLVLPGPGSLAMTSSGECKEQSNYRLGSEYCRSFYLPLEQIDRQVRPATWGLPWETRASARSSVGAVRTEWQNLTPLIRRRQ